MSSEKNLKQQYLQAIGVQSWELRTKITPQGTISTPETKDTADLSSHSVEKDNTHADRKHNPLSNLSVSALPADDDIVETSAGFRSEVPVEVDLTIESDNQAAISKPENTCTNSALDEIVAAVHNCKQCPERTHRLQPLAGQGNKQQADVFIITDAPSAEEDRAGVYLTDKAGDLYRAMLTTAGLIDQCYLTGLLKCHSLDLFIPTEIEVLQCFAFLSAQIKTLKPKVLVSLGRLPARHLLHSSHSLVELIDREHIVNIDGDEYPLVVTYHPGFLLRNPYYKKQSLKDLIRIRQLVFEQ